MTTETITSLAMLRYLADDTQIQAVIIIGDTPLNVTWNDFHDWAHNLSKLPKDERGFDFSFEFDPEKKQLILAKLEDFN